MNRRGWTVMESVVAIACLGIAATLVGQLAAWSIQERIRNEVRLTAIEWAANVLEEANATPWSALDDQWAAKQVLPAELAERMLNPTAAVIVGPEKDAPEIKRLSVRINWFVFEGAKAPPVEMMTFFAKTESQ